jgi:acyl-CoA reductase-like NAD-dependent aldehyde dehydrogenase
MPSAIFVAGQARSTETVVTLRSPWDPSILAEQCLADERSIEDAIASAHRHVAALRKTPTHARRRWLDAIADQLDDQRARLATLICEESGKPLKLARAEVARAATTFRLASEECARLGGEVLALDTTPAFEQVVGGWTRVSSGALLAITPFNFPLNLVAHKLAPAFALAMPVVLKPAPQTPRTALALAEIVKGVGAPEPLLSVLPTTVELASRMVEDPRFSAVSFTGSAAVGWSIKRRCGQKRALLELGGNASAIIAEDYPIDDSLVHKLDVGAYAYAGQICIKTQRVLIDERRRDELLERLCARASAHTISSMSDEHGIVGPLIDRRACERVRSWIDDAVERGARLCVGGQAQDNRMLPAVVADAPEGCSLVDDELFGPAVVVHGYRALDEALAAVERGRYGLQCSLFSYDTRVIRSAFESLSVGALIVNESTTFRVDSMPYGGVKDSGLGREGVRYAIDELSDKKLLVLR